jgi:hypothetical protein
MSWRGSDGARTCGHASSGGSVRMFDGPCRSATRRHSAAAAGGARTEPSSTWLSRSQLPHSWTFPRGLEWMDDEVTVAACRTALPSGFSCVA